MDDIEGSMQCNMKCTMKDLPNDILMMICDHSGVKHSLSSLDQYWRSRLENVYNEIPVKMYIVDDQINKIIKSSRFETLEEFQTRVCLPNQRYNLMIE